MQFVFGEILFYIAAILLMFVLVVLRILRSGYPDDKKKMQLVNRVEFVLSLGFILVGPVFVILNLLSWGFYLIFAIFITLNLLCMDFDLIRGKEEKEG